MKGFLNKQLFCEKCFKQREHRFETYEWREMSFRGIDEDGERIFFNGTGMKEIWTCNTCQTTRIYGAPSDMERLRTRVLHTGVEPYVDPPDPAEQPVRA